MQLLVNLFHNFSHSSQSYFSLWSNFQRNEPVGKKRKEKKKKKQPTNTYIEV